MILTKVLGILIAACVVIGAFWRRIFFLYALVGVGLIAIVRGVTTKSRALFGLAGGVALVVLIAILFFL